MAKVAIAVMLLNDVFKGALYTANCRVFSNVRNQKLELNKPI